MFSAIANASTPTRSDSIERFAIVTARNLGGMMTMMMMKGDHHREDVEDRDEDLLEADVEGFGRDRNRD